MTRWVAATVLALLAWTGPARAVEYRLLVASLHDKSFAYYLDGAPSHGRSEAPMERLERALDAADIPAGAMLLGRSLRPARGEERAAFGAGLVKVKVSRLEGQRRWEVLAWEGKPGERSLWVFSSGRMHDQEIARVALKGAGPLRPYIPSRISSAPAAVVSMPLGFLAFHADRGGLWAKYLSRGLGLESGIAAVVGVNDNPTMTDSLYVLVEHPPAPATFKVVVGWVRRPSTSWSDIEGGGWQ
jgi:hypothetical protein